MCAFLCSLFIKCRTGCYQEPPQVIAWALEKAQIKQTNRPGFRNRKPGRFLCCNVQEKQKISFTERTSKLSNRIVIIDRQKGINAIKGECAMKKIWMFLLGAAFAAELFLLVCMASRSASPRQVMYTFKDDVWDVIYRLNRRWNLWEKHLAFWRMDRQAVHLFFVYWGCAKETKILQLFHKTTKFHTKNCGCCCTVLQWTEKENELCVIVD